jgi:hypothetical protein
MVADLLQVKCDEIQPKCGVSRLDRTRQRSITHEISAALCASSQGLRLGSTMECMLISQRQSARVAGSKTHRNHSSAMLHQARKTNTAMSPRLEVRFGIVRYTV